MGDHFEVIRLSDLGYQVVVRDAPDWFRVVSSFDRVEDHGVSIEVAVAVWSAPDLEAIEVAREISISVGPTVFVCVRPFDDLDEVSDLLGNGSDRFAGQHWVIRCGSETRWRASGQQSSALVMSALRAACSERSE